MIESVVDYLDDGIRVLSLDLHSHRVLTFAVGGSHVQSQARISSNLGVLTNSRSPVAINLGEFHSALEMLGEFLKYRGKLDAVTAPRSIEVY